MTVPQVTDSTVADAAWANTVANDVNTNTVKMTPLMGITAARPILPLSSRGVLYFDTTLAAAGRPIWWTGTAWVNNAGVVV